MSKSRDAKKWTQSWKLQRGPHIVSAVAIGASDVVCLLLDADGTDGLLISSFHQKLTEIRHRCVMVSRDGKWCSTADVDALGCVESGAMNQRHQPQSQRSARSALSAVDVEQSGTETGRRPRLEQFNQFIVCGLCDGYLIDATTVAHCLHSCTCYSLFLCRSVSYMYLILNKQNVLTVTPEMIWT